MTCNVIIHYITTISDCDLLRLNYTLALYLSHTTSCNDHISAPSQPTSHVVVVVSVQL